MERNWNTSIRFPCRIASRQLSQPSPEHRTVPSPSSRPPGTLSDHPLRVLLVEDSALLVQRIAELVGELPDVEIAGTAATESEALALLASSDFDAVILDLQLHVGSGFGILRALHRRDPRPRVVVFTNFAIAAYRDTALALGASYFLDKSRDYDRLPGVLQEMSDTRH
jgi:DNA-binding NarL/FixJ family response regulator